MSLHHCGLLRSSSSYRVLIKCFNPNVLFPVVKRSGVWRFKVTNVGGLLLGIPSTLCTLLLLSNLYPIISNPNSSSAGDRHVVGLSTHVKLVRKTVTSSLLKQYGKKSNILKFNTKTIKKTNQNLKKKNQKLQNFLGSPGLSASKCIGTHQPRPSKAPLLRCPQLRSLTRQNERSHSVFLKLHVGLLNHTKD